MSQINKIAQLLARWNVVGDVCVRHVLENATAKEIDQVIASGFAPNHMSKKTPSELVAKLLCDIRERALPGGGVGVLDPVSAFARRFKLGPELEKELRALVHKDLRYVLRQFNGTRSVRQLMEDASRAEPERRVSTHNSLPYGAGVQTMGRFTRLEVIDPHADCVVFADPTMAFSLKLAKHRQALGHNGRVIATCCEDTQMLRESHPDHGANGEALELLGAEVYNCVDCTRIGIDPRFADMGGSLGAVYYNFPHGGTIKGFSDGHPMVNWRHENLMRLFFRSLRGFVKPGGMVKVASSIATTGVRSSYIVGSAIENEFRHVETIPFVEWHLHRHDRAGDWRSAHRRVGVQNGNGPSVSAQDQRMDMVYCFTYEPRGPTLHPLILRQPPTLQTLTNCPEGPFRDVHPSARPATAKRLHARFQAEMNIPRTV